MLADLMAVKSGRLTQKSLLGVLTISSVPDRGVKLSKFRKEWISEGLDINLVPEERKPVNVFQEACRLVGTGKRGVPSENRVTEILAEQVTNNEGECVYQITRAVKDKQARLIEHPKAMRMVYNKVTGTIDCEPLDPDSYLELRHIEAKVREHFDANVKTVPGAHVRTGVRETLLSLGATRVANAASVYFVPISGYSAVEALQRVLTNLYNGDAYIHVIPWLDTDATREIVEKHHTMDVKAQCEELVAEIHNRLKDQGNGQSKVRRDYATNKINERIALSRRIKEYESLLGTEIEEIKTAMGLLDDQIERLMGAAA
jgi:hypothetical protein